METTGEYPEPNTQGDRESVQETRAAYATAARWQLNIVTPVNNQGVALRQPGIQRVPAPPAVGTGDTDVLIDVRKLHAGSQQQLAWVYGSLPDSSETLGRLVRT